MREPLAKGGVTFGHDDGHGRRSGLFVVSAVFVLGGGGRGLPRRSGGAGERTAALDAELAFRESELGGFEGEDLVNTLAIL